MRETQILVVEDEIIVAEDIRRSLKNLGYSVPAVASSGETAVKKAEDNGPDLVLMDIMLQGEMDGVTAAGIIRSKFDIPIVYLTAYSDNRILERAKITEPFGYIIKPFNERELAINIEIALYKHKMEKKLKDSKEWYHVTLRSISDAVIATDPKGCVLFMNPVAQEMTGWKMELAENRPLKEVFDITGPGNKTILVSKDKEQIQIQESSDTIRDDKGNIIGIVIVFRRV